MRENVLSGSVKPCTDCTNAANTVIISSANRARTNKRNKCKFVVIVPFVLFDTFLSFLLSTFKFTNTKNAKNRYSPQTNARRMHGAFAVKSGIVWKMSVPFVRALRVWFAGTRCTNWFCALCLFPLFAAICCRWVRGFTSQFHCISTLKFAEILQS